MGRNTRQVSAWEELLGLASAVLSAGRFGVFQTLLVGWVLAPGRRTITAMVRAGDPGGHRAHDAYHRFVRVSRWAPEALWRVLVVFLVGRLCLTGVVPLDVDDTLYKKTGPKISGAGIFRDAVRSTSKTVAFAWGLNLVVVTLRVQPPWGGCPIALPVSVRLARKGATTTTVDLAEDMLARIASWLPERSFAVCCDGAYAGLIGRGLERTTITSRMRRDAAIYEAAPPPTGRRGRPRTRGERLPAPAELSKTLSVSDFAHVEIDCRGEVTEVLTWSRTVLWYAVERRRMVTLVIVRHPSGAEPDHFFVTDEPDATATDALARYVGRWSIEICFREAKQCLGAEDPQSWKGEGPERAAMLSLWLYSVIWAWYIAAFGSAPTWSVRPWYTRKRTPSFLDALAACRRMLWGQRITSLSSPEPQDSKILDGMLDALAHAA